MMNKTTTLQANNQIIILTTLLNSNIKKRILLVDDEPDITLTFKIDLESTDYLRFIRSMKLYKH